MQNKNQEGAVVVPKYVQVLLDWEVAVTGNFSEDMADAVALAQFEEENKLLFEEELSMLDRMDAMVA